MINNYLAGYFNVDSKGQITLREDLKCRVKKLNSKAKIPVRAHSTDAGIDFFSTINDVIPPGGRRSIPTGIACAVPEGWALILKDKSGLAKNNGVHIMAGVVDCFSEDSLISTVDGLKTIKEIKINDSVFSVNEETGEIEKDYITDIIDSGNQEILIFETDFGELKVTKGTKVYTNNGIKLAEEISKDDELIFDKF